MNDEDTWMYHIDYVTGEWENSMAGFKLYPPTDYDKLNIPLIIKWIESLRSGNNVQGAEYLEYFLEGETTPRRCCLGVACRVAMAEVLGLKLSVKRSWFADDTHKHLTAFDGNDFILPESVMEALGFNDANPAVFVRENGEVKRYSLTHLNDGNKLKGIAPRTFAEIADILESNFVRQEFRDISPEEVLDMEVDESLD